jgi:hypothetical protein
MAFEFKTITDYTGKAIDADIGNMKDILFDETSLQVRYFVIDKSPWLPGKKIVLPSTAIDTIDPAKQELLMSLLR